ncbi:DEAD/DEAH box helicase [Clostridium butyricum]|uniref:DEAD/DEAH box helicase n=1 Tax=Clostridium butyricum TaxID=1492 RepID=UPI003467B82A
MAYNFNLNYFTDSLYNIKDNPNIRQPQLEAYYKTLEYFSNDYDDRNALIVLPTGVGKTGVMGLIPFGLCKKRTLIITPGNTIKNTVLESLDPSNPDNFWYKRKVIEPGFVLPNVIEYEGSDTPPEVLNVANIVIINIQKLQSRLDSSLIYRVAKDFFDVIIIDEAHHSTANTWIECTNHFAAAKVIKLTGTPFRTDGEQIVGKLIYKYSLSRAMYHGYVKSLSNIQYAPNELKLTIDNNTDELYSVEDILNMKLRDQDWVTRCVAYSLSCSQSIVDESIVALNEKRSTTDIPHKIIAVACSIPHAKQIAELYQKRGIRTTIIHSDLPPDVKDRAFKDIENHRVDAVINVAMLGEGYDHCYLTIAAIFRPFRNELPYTQFIGRVLRHIPEGNAKDNVAIIISHKHLYLERLWEKYKREIQESEIIKSLKDFEDILDNTLDDSSNTADESSNSRNLDPLGTVHQSKSHTLDRDDYLDTELIKKSKEEDEKIREKIQQLQQLLSVTEEQARLLVKQSQVSADNSYGRPDLLYKRKKKDLNSTIQEEIIPKLIETYNIDKDGIDIKDTGLFVGPYWYIPNQVLKQKYDGKNAAMLAMYYNKYLRDKIGRPRSEWTDDDFINAFKYTGNLTNHIDSILKRYYNHK